MNKIQLQRRERLRRSYRPERTELLFIGEAPPASGRFFYQADSGLYRAVRDAFTKALALDPDHDFLRIFQSRGCYLVDLCGVPVDHLGKQARLRACLRSEIRLARILRNLRPKIIVIVVKSIVLHVKRAQREAGWSGKSIELVYPGRWTTHRKEFFRVLVPFLRKLFAETELKKSTIL